MGIYAYRRELLRAERKLHRRSMGMLRRQRAEEIGAGSHCAAQREQLRAKLRVIRRFCFVRYFTDWSTDWSSWQGQLASTAIFVYCLNLSELRGHMLCVSPAVTSISSRRSNLVLYQMFAVTVDLFMAVFKMTGH